MRHMNSVQATGRVAHIVLIDDDEDGSLEWAAALRRMGHAVSIAAADDSANSLLRAEPDVVIIEESSARDHRRNLARDLLDATFSGPPIMIISRGDIATPAAGPQGIANKPSARAAIENTLRLVADGQRRRQHNLEDAQEGKDSVCHAIERWVKALLPLLDCRRDPKTLARWAECVAASPGAIKNWCHTAGVSPRHSLVFARMLRAVLWQQRTGGRTEDLLDAVDRRTIAGLFKMCGLPRGRSFELPRTAEEFLLLQRLIDSESALREWRRVLESKLPATGPVVASAMGGGVSVAPC